MKKIIRLKEVYEHGRKVRSILKNNMNNSNQYQPTGASSTTMDPKTAKVKELFEMFGLNR